MASTAFVGNAVVYNAVSSLGKQVGNLIKYRCLSGDLTTPFNVPCRVDNLREKTRGHLVLQTFVLPVGATCLAHPQQIGEGGATRFPHCGSGHPSCVLGPAIYFRFLAASSPWRLCLPSPVASRRAPETRVGCRRRGRSSSRPASEEASTATSRTPWWRTPGRLWSCKDPPRSGHRETPTARRRLATRSGLPFLQRRTSRA